MGSDSNNDPDRLVKWVWKSTLGQTTDMTKIIIGGEVRKRRLDEELVFSTLEVILHYIEVCINIIKLVIFYWTWSKRNSIGMTIALTSRGEV